MAVFNKFAAFQTVNDAAAVASDMLAAAKPLGRVWRFAVVQLLDDYMSVLRHQGVDTAARMWMTAPDATGDSRVDAAFAALAEFLARRDGWRTPAWTRDPAREAMPWWFVTRP